MPPVAGSHPAGWDPPRKECSASRISASIGAFPLVLDGCTSAPGWRIAACVRAPHRTTIREGRPAGGSSPRRLRRRADFPGGRGSADQSSVRPRPLEPLPAPTRSPSRTAAIAGHATTHPSRAGRSPLSTASEFDDLTHRGLIRLVHDPDAGVPLRSLTDFDFWIGEHGVVAVSDTARSPLATVHQPRLPHVDRDHFEEKVIANEGSNGSYRWYRSRRAAERDGAAACPTCEW